MTGFKINFLRKRFQKTLTLLLLIPFFGGIFCGVVEAAVFPCKGIECESLLQKENKQYQEIVKFHRSFSECLRDCGLYSDWSTCQTDFGEEKNKSCKDIVSLSKKKTGEYDYNKMEEKLNTMKMAAEKKMAELKLVIQSQKSVNVKKILSITGQSHFKDAGDFLNSVIDLLIKMVGVVALAFLLFGGFRLVVSAGSDNETQKAKSMIQYSIVGLVMALLAYLIVAGVQGILYR